MCFGSLPSTILRGLVREVCSTVPPVRSIVRVLSRVSGRIYIGSSFESGHVRQPLPSLANADDLTAHFIRAIDDRLDHRVQSRHVAAARQDSNIVFRSHVMLLLTASGFVRRGLFPQRQARLRDPT